jgi:cbb3-type cytochrome oxidase maturation protein
VNIVLLLIPLGLVLMGAAVAALFWAVNSGQYDDLEDASRSVLEPDETKSGSSASQADTATGKRTEKQAPQGRLGR